MSDAPLILTSTADGVTTVTLNRPERRNALNSALIEALIETLDRLAGDEATRVVVLTGAGEKAFCAGGDLSTMPQGGLLDLHDERARFVDLLRAMASLGKPIVARVAGHALGGGFGLLCACDLAVVADDVSLGTPEIKVGLFPMMIMALIVRTIGRKHALELMLTGDRITPKRALDLGLVNRVVPRDTLDAEVADLAGRIACHSPAILKLGRDAFYRSQDMNLWDALDFLRSQLTLNTLTEDAAEGIMAFLTKRAPEWKGR